MIYFCTIHSIIKCQLLHGIYYACCFRTTVKPKNLGLTTLSTGCYGSHRDVTPVTCPSTHVHGKTRTQSSQRRPATAPKWKITPMTTDKGTDHEMLWQQPNRTTMLRSKNGLLV